MAFETSKELLLWAGIMQRRHRRVKKYCSRFDSGGKRDATLDVPVDIG